MLQNLLIGRHCHAHTGILEQLLFLPSARRDELAHREKAEDVIAFLGLERYRDTLIANLPYGVRKVVELGRALCIEPKLLLLDEPSSGLNVEETEGMGFWIEDIKKDLGITVIMVEHDMNLVSQVSDRVMALNYGKVMALGTPEEVQTHPEVVRAYIGGEVAHERRRAIARRSRDRDLLRPDPGDPRRQPGCRAGPDRHRAGCQRRGQNHSAAHDFRRAGPGTRQGGVPGRATSRTCRRTR